MKLCSDKGFFGHCLQDVCVKMLTPGQAVLNNCSVNAEAKELVSFLGDKHDLLKTVKALPVKSTPLLSTLNL